MTYFQHVKQKITLLGQVGLKGEEEEKRQSLLERLNNYFIELNKPQKFREDDPDNAMVRFETQYNTMLAGLETNGIATQGLTVMQLYSRINYFKIQKKPEN